MSSVKNICQYYQIIDELNESTAQIKFKYCQAKTIGLQITLELEFATNGN